MEAALRVEFLLKTDSGYLKDTGVNKPWQPLRISSAITPTGSVVEKHILLHISGSWLIRVQLFHPWAALAGSSKNLESTRS